MTPLIAILLICIISSTHAASDPRIIEGIQRNQKDFCLKPTEVDFLESWDCLRPRVGSGKDKCCEGFSCKCGKDRTDWASVPYDSCKCIRK